MDGKMGEDKEEELEAMANRGPATSHPIIGLSTPSARLCQEQTSSFF